MAVSDWSTNPTKNTQLNGYSLSGPYGHVFAVMMAEIKELADALNEDIIYRVPIGTVMMFSGNTVPEGFLVCDGSAVDRAEYSDLFGVIGEVYGDGNGSTTFNLPNLVEKFMEGGTASDVGTSIQAGLPNITGKLGFNLSFANYNTVKDESSYNPSNSALWWDGHGDTSPMSRDTTQSDRLYNVDFNASRSSAIYGGSSTVQPNALQLLPCIRAV